MILDTVFCVLEDVRERGKPRPPGDLLEAKGNIERNGGDVGSTAVVTTLCAVCIVANGDITQKIIKELIRLSVRYIEESDYSAIIPVLDAWWGGRHMADMLPRLFFKHFRNTSFAIEEENAIIAFLIGFISQADPKHAYIHFLGIHPEHRKKGLGRQLHQSFSDAVRIQGCDTVHLVTSPVNKQSIAFHTHIGFQIEEGDYSADGVSIQKDYDGPGENRVSFLKKI